MDTFIFNIDEFNFKVSICDKVVHFLEITNEPTTKIPKNYKWFVNRMENYFIGKDTLSDIEVYQEGTVFQKKVWDTLRTIPYGEVITYKELAIKYGNVKATRAVANANGKNKISILVPWHRVIASDGSLGGFSAIGGIKTKARLLEIEKNK